MSGNRRIESKFLAGINTKIPCPPAWLETLRVSVEDVDTLNAYFLQRYRDLSLQEILQLDSHLLDAAVVLLWGERRAVMRGGDIYLVKKGDNSTHPITEPVPECWSSLDALRGYELKAAANVAHLAIYRRALQFVVKNESFGKMRLVLSRSKDRARALVVTWYAINKGTEIPGAES